MARQPDSRAFRFALVFALAVIVLALTTWVAPKRVSEWAAPLPPSEPIILKVGEQFPGCAH